MKTEDWSPLRVLYEDGGEGGGEENDAGAGVEGSDGGKKPEFPEGAFTLETWREVLPEDIRNHSALEKVANPEAMARSLISAQKMLGNDPNNLVAVPKADDVEGRKAVLQRLGLPNDTSGYKLEKPENAPDWLAPDAGLGKGFVEQAHKLGILPDQAAGLYSWFSGELGQAAADQAAKDGEQDEANVAAIKKEWGEAFDQKIAGVNDLLDRIGGSELKDKISQTGLGADPLFLKAIDQIVPLFAEDDAGGERKGSGGAGGKLTPNEAVARARGLQRDALNSSDPAERRRLNEEAQRYYKIAYPDNVK